MTPYTFTGWTREPMFRPNFQGTPGTLPDGGFDVRGYAPMQEILDEFQRCRHSCDSLTLTVGKNAGITFRLFRAAVANALMQRR